MLIKELKNEPLHLTKIEGGYGFFMCMHNSTIYEVIVDFEVISCPYSDMITLRQMFGGLDLKVVANHVSVWKYDDKSTVRFGEALARSARFNMRRKESNEWAAKYGWGETF